LKRFITLIFIIVNGFCHAQNSSVVDCGDGIDLFNPDGVLTREEKLQLLDKSFNVEVSEKEECQINQSSSSSNSASSGSSSISSSGNAGSSRASSNSNNSSITVSPNQVTNSQSSIHVNSNLKTSSDTSSENFVGEGNVGGDNGKDHEKLQKVDNRKLLAEKILQKANEEQDPKIKAELMAKYKILNK